MNTKRFMPEGWNEKIAKIDESQARKFIKSKRTLQGIVEKCDDEYNLHINLGNKIKGIMPRSEVEGINIEEDGLPKVNLCTGKVNRYVQFKIKDITEDNVALLSRKDVQKEALKWVKKDLKEGDLVTRNSKKNRKLRSFY